MDKQNRRGQWWKEWKQLCGYWEVKLLIAAWVAALILITGMILGGPATRRNTPPGPNPAKPLLNVVFAGEAEEDSARPKGITVVWPSQKVYTAKAYVCPPRIPGGTLEFFEWPYSV